MVNHAYQLITTAINLLKLRKFDCRVDFIVIYVSACNFVAKSLQVQYQIFGSAVEA